MSNYTPHTHTHTHTTYTTHTVVHFLVVSVYFMNILTHDVLVLVLEGITRKYG